VIQFIDEIHSTQAIISFKMFELTLKKPVLYYRLYGSWSSEQDHYWSTLQETCVLILDMGNVYCEMKKSFDKDASNIIAEDTILKSAESVHKDEAWKILTESSESDFKTEATPNIIQCIFHYHIKIGD